MEHLILQAIVAPSQESNILDPFLVNYVLNNLPTLQKTYYLVGIVSLVV